VRKKELRGEKRKYSSGQKEEMTGKVKMKSWISRE